jgi:hypothetical protein
MQKPEKKFNCGPISASILAKAKMAEGQAGQTTDTAETKGKAEILLWI